MNFKQRFIEFCNGSLAWLVLTTAPVAAQTPEPPLTTGLSPHQCMFVYGTGLVPKPGFPSSSEHPAHLLDATEVEWLIGDLPFNDSTVGIFIMPGETVSLKVSHAGGLRFEPEIEVGALAVDGANHWWWKAPDEPGHTELVFISQDGLWKTVINAFVKLPVEESASGMLEAFRVGHYPSETEMANKPRYSNPDGFVEVNEHTNDLKISTNFRLGEFVSKQAGGFPKYVYVEEKLISKLERIRRVMNENGVDVRNLHVMSGYRTPFYNKQIGNVKFSRHVFGDAADIYVDNDRNGRMDDLNEDGVVDIEDAREMASVVETFRNQVDYKPLVGGLGIYGPAPHRGPFIHVDTRGYVARWTSP